MKSQIIIVGDEIILGDAIDTNSAYIGRVLGDLGIEVSKKISVRDCAADIKNALKESANEADIIFVLGGLGPTRDDITREVVSCFAKKKLVFHNDLYKSITRFFGRRGIEVPAISKVQAYIPQGAEVIKNRIGTAPGFLIKKGRKTIVVLPGPPHELQPMSDSVVPYLKRLTAGSKVLFDRIIRTHGIGESAIEEKLAGFKNTKNLKIGFQAKPGQVDIRVSAAGNDARRVKNSINRIAGKIEKIFKDFRFSGKKEDLGNSAGRILKSGNLTVSIAESCSGGIISDMITNIPGASEYFRGSIIAYSNNIKEKILKVPHNIIKEYGAVSEKTALFMARGVRKVCSSNIGISSTGIAGPGGGTRKKSVGLVYIALADKNRATAYKFNFPGTRVEIKRKTAVAALDLLRKFILKIDNKYTKTILPRRH